MDIKERVVCVGADVWSLIVIVTGGCVSLSRSVPLLGSIPSVMCHCHCHCHVLYPLRCVTLFPLLRAAGISLDAKFILCFVSLLSSCRGFPTLDIPPKYKLPPLPISSLDTATYALALTLLDASFRSFSSVGMCVSWHFHPSITILPTAVSFPSSSLRPFCSQCAMAQKEIATYYAKLHST